MQEEKKKLIFEALSKTVKKLRGNKSQYLHGGEYGIPPSVISDIERAVKDPQLTTLFKLANSFNMTLSDFALAIEKELPKDFSVIED